jgi:hypothetical protein
VDKKIFAGLAALAAVSLLLILVLPGSPENSRETLPWNITHPAPGLTRAFGVTLGQSTLGDAEHAFKEQAEISLFKPAEAGMSVEAFLEEVNFNGLKAKIVMTVTIPPDELQAMFARGLRMNSTPGGKRITLAPDDLTRVRQAPVTSLAYMPAVRLEEDMLASRFGPPAERVRETQTGVMHWLYPQLGLDVALGGREKPVLQYVPPRDFEKLRGPLLANGEVVK